MIETINRINKIIRKGIQENVKSQMLKRLQRSWITVDKVKQVIKITKSRIFRSLIEVR